MTPSEFFKACPVFRHEEFIGACYPTALPTSRAAARALAHHQATGRLILIRRGLYAVRSSGGALSSFQIASKAAPDAVLAYHTALEYLGNAHSVWSDRFILTSSKMKGFDHEGVRYRPTSVPRALDTDSKRTLGVEVRDDGGVTVRVTGLERTLVDLLDRPVYAGGWEEIWRSFENAGFLDTKLVLRHVRNLASRTTAARAGWFLEEHRKQWLIPDAVLTELEGMVPASPVYLLRSRRESGELHARWNLIVPRRVTARIWEEVS